MATNQTGVEAEDLSASETTFVGMYVQRSVDAQSQLFLLDDRTFCFTFMGGALDLIKVGRWHRTKEKGVLNLQEERVKSQIHPAFAKKLDRLEGGMIGINFDGYTLSEAYSPAYAISGSNVVPDKLTPLFSDENTSWSQTYALPLIEMDKARYIFIGDIEVDKYGKPKQQVRVTQYKLEHYDAVRIGFNRIQAEPPMNVNVSIEGNILFMDGSRFGVKDELDAETIKEVREQCIKPILQQADNEESNKHQGNKKIKGKMLVPTKTFYMSSGAISGNPIFENADEKSTTETDSFSGMIELEKLQLQASFKGAMDKQGHVDDYLNLVKKISEKKNRVKRHIPQIVEDYAHLLVKIVGSGDYRYSEKLFFYFVENVYPHTKGYENDEMSYAISMIASQGLIITTPLKNTKISTIVFEQLLGDEYDINTHSNATLIYNMACYHAVNNNVQEMLAAIKQARKRGKPPGQFLKDTDFKRYWNDPEFLMAIN